MQPGHDYSVDNNQKEKKKKGGGSHMLGSKFGNIHHMRWQVREDQFQEDPEAESADLDWRPDAPAQSSALLPEQAARFE